VKRCFACWLLKRETIFFGTVSRCNFFNFCQNLKLNFKRV
jgi:hypothetical protein